MRRQREKARRDARTPEQKSAYQSKQRERERKRREWLKLPGNEAEREAKKLKNQASFNRHFAKPRTLSQ